MKATVTKPTHDTTTPMYDAEVSFDQDRSTNDLIIKNHQYIPENFISDLKSDKMDSRNKRSPDMLHVMSIPVSVIQDLKDNYGYDAMEEPIRRTISMLKALHLDAFITTDKQI
jgi:hypothetical protein